MSVHVGSLLLCKILSFQMFVSPFPSAGPRFTMCCIFLVYLQKRILYLFFITNKATRLIPFLVVVV